VLELVTVLSSQQLIRMFVVLKN